MADPTLVCVARTLRQAALWVDEEGRKAIYDAAERVEAADQDSLYMICPVCEETDCDEGCPLAELRARIDNEERNWEREAEDSEREELEAEERTEQARQ